MSAAAAPELAGTTRKGWRPLRALESSAPALNCAGLGLELPPPMRVLALYSLPTAFTTVTPTPSPVFGLSALKK